MAKLEGRVDGFEARFDSLERRFDALEAKMSSQFWWLLGTQLTVFVTVITVLAGALFVR